MNAAEKRNVREALRKIKLTSEQKEVLSAIDEYPVTILRGRPGTAKTFTAVYAALERLANSEIDSIALTRPLVATEDIGILPGDIDDKVDPYLYPIISFFYDTLHLDFDKMATTGAIRKAPLAFMRGQTVHHEVLLVDEAQNITPKQMLMVLTRLGEGSRIVITGDEDQSDLRTPSSGLDIAVKLADVIPHIVHSVVMEENMRSPLITEIVDAWVALTKSS